MSVISGATPEGAMTAGPDRENATQTLNRELTDKGFLLTTADDLINWARAAVNRSPFRCSTRASMTGFPPVARWKGPMTW